MSFAPIDHQLGQARQILATLPAGVYTSDAGGLITGYNDHAVRLWGRTPLLNDVSDRFCGSFRLFSVEGAMIDHSECWMAKSLRMGQEFIGHEIVIERTDGSRVTALTHATPVRDATGQLIGAVNVLVDITDRKRAETAQAQLAAIVESSQDAIISKSLEGVIMSWNSAAERLFGYSANEAVGQPITLIIPEERREEEVGILEKLRRGERIQHFATQRLTRQGGRVAVSLSVSPVRDSTGRIVAASSVARDISVQQEVQATLLEVKDELATQVADLQRLHDMSLQLSSTRELQPILDQTLTTATAIAGASCGLLSLYDAEDRSLKVGASLGFDAEFLKLVECVTPVCGAWGASFAERRRIVVVDIESDPVFASYRAVVRKAGIRSVHSTPLMTRQGAIIGVLSVHYPEPHQAADRETRMLDLCARQAVDFIENARLYADLREADRRKTEFLATLAHELRNPLAPISNAIQILRLSGESSPAAASICSVMERQVEQLTRLVEDLLEVSRITRGKIALRNEQMDVRAAINTALETSRPWIEAAGHHLKISLAPDPMMIEGDPVRVAQVIVNLLNNAAKYTPSRGHISLSLRRDRDNAVITVRDDGMGIPPEMLSRVFDMFAQIDHTLNRSHGGLGIGLTLAKNLVQLHGGSITAHSAGVGRGSEFVVRFPLLEVALPQTGAPAPPPARRTFPARRILVVDDTRAAAHMLGKLLESLGQEVQTVNDGATALDSVRTFRPDLVISDIGMPKMDGYALARALRGNAESQDLTLVALTGFGQESDRLVAREAGFDFHLVKPVSLSELQSLLSTLPARQPEPHECQPASCASS
jgi:PAS domain S-box-containing protein